MGSKGVKLTEQGTHQKMPSLVGSTAATRSTSLDTNGREGRLWRGAMLRRSRALRFLCGRTRTPRPQLYPSLFANDDCSKACCHALVSQERGACVLERVLCAS